MLYISVFIIVLFFYVKTYNTKYAHDPKILALIIFLLAMVVGMSDMLGGYDRYLYADLFDREADRVTVGLPSMAYDNPLYVSYESEMAYVLWNILVAHVTENRYIFILLSTLFMFLLVYKSIRDYIDDNYFFAVLAFLAIWFFFSHTYLRQAMATVVAWYGMRYAIQRKPLGFFLCAFIAYEFHNSAIVFFPFYFLPLKKWHKRKVILTLIILFVIGFTGLTSSLYTIYGGDDESSRNHAYDIDDTGGRMAYLFEIVVFMYFVFKRYDKLTTKKDFVFLNAAICFCGMLLFFFRSSNAGRQSWYFSIGFIYLFTKLYTHQRNIGKYNKWLLTIFFGLYLRIVVAWGSLLSPYKTFLTDGYRPNDYILTGYEYDWYYEQDKMYRRPFRLIIGM